MNQKAVLTLVIVYDTDADHDMPNDEDISEVLEKARETGRVDVAEMVYSPPLERINLLKERL